jgi:hypothetical protein
MNASDARSKKIMQASLGDTVGNQVCFRKNPNMWRWLISQAHFVAAEFRRAICGETKAMFDYGRG